MIININQQSYRGNMGKKTVKMLSIIGTYLGIFTMAYALWVVIILGNSPFMYPTLVLISGFVLSSVSCIIWGIVERNDKLAEDQIFYV